MGSLLGGRSKQASRLWQCLLMSYHQCVDVRVYNYNTITTHSIDLCCLVIRGPTRWQAWRSWNSCKISLKGSLLWSNKISLVISFINIFTSPLITMMVLSKVPWPGQRGHRDQDRVLGRGEEERWLGQHHRTWTSDKETGDLRFHPTFHAEEIQQEDLQVPGSFCEVFEED